MNIHKMTCPNCDCFGSYSTTHKEISKCIKCGTKWKLDFSQESNTKAVRQGGCWG